MNLYTSTSGNSWTYNTGWTKGDPCGVPNGTKWYGISCSCHIHNCTIQSLYLPTNQLVGTIPSSIGNLINLMSLTLSGNQLSGAIPESIGNLTGLTYLDLSTNQLSSTIPESIGNLSKLTFLALYSTDLSGTIPTSIGKLSSLEFLELFSTSLAGTIPESIGNLFNLLTINLFTNQLSGSIPESIGNLTGLTYLDLHENPLVGTIPDSIGKLTSLLFLDLESNQLSGTIPESIGNLVGLTVFSLYINPMISGTIPAGIGNLTFLKWLGLQYNKLSGTIPESIGNLTGLTHLAIDTNELSGTIPESIGNLTGLTVLILGASQLTGTIPESFGDLTSLASLYLSSNKLSGTIPEFIRNFTSLLILALNANQLSGTIPEYIGDLTSLTVLDLDTNQLSGTIPESIGNLSSLLYLDLSYNQLSGTISSSIGSLTSLTYLDLRSNMLINTIPASISNMINLVILDMSQNNLSCFDSDWKAVNQLHPSSCSFKNNDFDCYIGGSCNWTELKSNWNITNCPFPCSSLEPIPTPTNTNNKPPQLAVGSIIGIICGFIVFLLICVIIAFLLWKKYGVTTIQLPPEITWSFIEAQLGGEKKEHFKIKLLPEDGKAHKTVLDMFYNQLGGGGIIISQIFAVYQENLLNAFVIYERNLQHRLINSPHLFQQQQWKKNDTEGLKQWIMDRFDNFVNSFSWNTDRKCKIIPQLHGTNFGTAMAICNSGFATLSLLDSGWYGKGIYFSSSAVYLTPYFATKEKPAIILSYIIPGNPYPVTEHPNREKNLIGSGLYNGAQSHYVVTTSSGFPVEQPQEVCYDELVITQESQVLPAFILSINPSNAQELLKQHQREIVENDGPEPAE